MRTACGSCVRGENRKHAFCESLFGHGGDHGDASSTQRLGKLGCEGNLQVEGGKCIDVDKHFLGCADARYLPPVENDDAVGEGCLLHEVGDHDDGHALIVERAHDAHEALAAPGVEHRGGLVQDEDLRVHRKGARDGDALLLSAGKRVRLMLLKPRKTDVLEALGHAFAQLGGGNAEVLGPEGNVVFHKGGDQLVIRVLKYHAGALANRVGVLALGGVHAANLHPPLIGNEQRVQMLRERGFPRPVAAEHAYELAARDAHACVRERKRLAVVGERDVAYADDGGLGALWGEVCGQRLPSHGLAALHLVFLRRDEI